MSTQQYIRMALFDEPAKAEARQNLFSEDPATKHLAEAVASIRQKIEYDSLARNYADTKQHEALTALDLLVEAAANAMTSEGPYVAIGGKGVPIEQFRETISHISQSAVILVINRYLAYSSTIAGGDEAYLLTSITREITAPTLGDDF